MIEFEFKHNLQAAADCKAQPAVIDLYERTYPAEMAWAFGEVE